MGRSSRASVAKLAWFLFLGAGTLAAPATAAQPPLGSYPPQMDGVRIEVYKTVGDVRLKLYVFNPQNRSAAEQRPAIVFFFGSGFRFGTPQQFEPQCRYLASRGLVAITADYRVSSRQRVKAPEEVRDAKSAIRWVRQNASRLGIVSSHIAAGGGSAGGYLAAAAGVIAGLDELSENLTVSSRPDALVLLNPVLILGPVPEDQVTDQEGWRKFQESSRAMPELAGVNLVALSPYNHVGKGAPPTIILHGKADHLVPYFTAELFTKKMIAAGNRCELVGFDGEDHGFFNYGRSGNKGYDETLQKVDEFLTSLGYLKGKTGLQ